MQTAVKIRGFASSNSLYKIITTYFSLSYYHMKYSQYCFHRFSSLPSLMTPVMPCRAVAPWHPTCHVVLQRGVMALYRCDDNVVRQYIARLFNAFASLAQGNSSCSCSTCTVCLAVFYGRRRVHLSVCLSLHVFALTCFMILSIAKTAFYGVSRGFDALERVWIWNLIMHQFLKTDRNFIDI